MTVLTPTHVQNAKPSPLAGDSFRFSVLLLLGVVLVQRVLGLVRSILFCGMLDAEDLGRWTLLASFIGWASPFVVLGLPGTFGRVAEHYRQRGHLRTFLKRTLLVSGTMIGIAVIVFVAFSRPLAAGLFNDPKLAEVMPLLGIVIAAVIAMNWLVSLMMATRLSRIVSAMQIAHNLAFTVIGVVLLMLTPWRAVALLAAFGLASAMAAAIGAIYLIRLWHAAPSERESPPASNFWKHLLPFAAAVWCSDLAMNLFYCTDQIVLKHWPGLPAAQVDALLGQLYAGRILPALVFSVATMISGSLLPYLTQDWEAGRLDAVHRRMNFVVKIAAIGFTLIAGLTHVTSPLLFTWLLRGKYDAGLEVMPWAFVQSSWMSLAMIASLYLLCCNQTRWRVFATLLGCVACFLGTVGWFPTYGITGVVLATVAANALHLACLVVLAAQLGMKWERGVWLALVLPLTSCLGGWATLGITAATILGSLSGNWLLKPDEVAQTLHFAGRWLDRIEMHTGLRLLRRTSWHVPRKEPA